MDTQYLLYTLYTYIMLHSWHVYKYQTKSQRNTGPSAGDRNYERRRKDSKIVAAVAKTNRGLEIENSVTWNCLTLNPSVFLYMLAFGLTNNSNKSNVLKEL